MQVRVAESAGFCSGVRRALDLALQEAERGRKVFTLGPLVHNEAVKEFMAQHQVYEIGSPLEAAGAILLIRAHGVSPEVWEEIRKRGDITVVDATCARVKRLQQYARELSEQGKQIIILGDKNHPEVKGVLGWAGNRGEVIASAEELKNIEIRAPAALLAQTTVSGALFEQVKEAFLQKVPDGQVFETLCPETRRRQEEAVSLARQVDAMVVVGSATSANTGTLVELCRKIKPTWRVMNAGELPLQELKGFKVVGVTAGASTPHWTIKEVVERMENEKLENGVNGEVQEAGEKEKNEINGAALPQAGAEQEAREEAAVEESRAEEQPAAAAQAQEEPAGEEQGADHDKEGEEQSRGQEEVTGEAAGAEETPETPAAAAPQGESEGEGAAAQEEGEAPEEAEEQEQLQFIFEQELKRLEPGERVTGKIVRVTPDEVYVDVGYKTEALLPRSEVYLGEGEKLTDRFAASSDIRVLVLNVDEQEGRILVSNKRVAREEKWEQLEKCLNEGKVLEGKVKQVVPAGMVIDLGAGIEGFMPGSLVDMRYIPDFKPFLGQPVSFKVVEINRDKDKVILSRKKVLEEEAVRKKEAVLNSLQPGSVIPGVVRRLTDFGAFVDVGGIDGLVHISEISWERIEHPQEVLKVGQEVEVKVLEVIPERERISLSLRQVQPDPWTLVGQEFSDGEIVTGKVTRLVNFGAFVELRPGVEGLVHISQIADYHVKHPSDVLQEGQEVKVKILDLKPEAKRVSLSIKAVKENVSVPADQAREASSEGDGGGVTLGDVFGELFEESNLGVSGGKEENSGEEVESAGDQGEKEEDS